MNVKKMVYAMEKEIVQKLLSILITNVIGLVPILAKIVKQVTKLIKYNFLTLKLLTTEFSYNIWSLQ